GPFSAPAIAIDTGGQLALPSPAGSAGAAPSVALTSLPFSSIWTCSTIFRLVWACSSAGFFCWQPAKLSTTSPALPSATALRATRPRTFHLRVNVFLGIDDPASIGQGADASGRT